MSVLLIGATGRTGIHLATRLHQQGTALRVIIRDPRRQSVFADLGAQALVIDLRDDFSRAFDGVDTVIYAAGSGESEGDSEERAIDRDAIVSACDYAKRYRCQMFAVISTLLASNPGGAPRGLEHYAQMKQEADEHVIASGLDYLILRPGPLDDGEGRGSIGAIEAPALDAATVARRDVAHVCAAALDAGLRNRILGFGAGTEAISDWMTRLKRR